MYQPLPVEPKGPIILGANGDPIQNSNSNKQKLDNPNLTGTIIPKDFISMLNPKAKEEFMEQVLATNREALRNDVIEKGKTDLKDDDSTMYKEPRSGCKKCSGQGRVGWNSKTGSVIICNCMRRGKLMNTSPDEFISAKRFMEIFMVPKPGYPRDHVRPKSIRRKARREHA